MLTNRNLIKTLLVFLISIYSVFSSDQQDSINLRLFIGNNVMAISGTNGFLPILAINRNHMNYCLSKCIKNDSLPDVSKALHYAFSLIHKKYFGKASDLDSVQIFIENSIYDKLNINCIETILKTESFTIFTICKMDGQSFTQIRKMTVRKNINEYVPGTLSYDSKRNIYTLRHNK